MCLSAPTRWSSTEQWALLLAIAGTVLVTFLPCLSNGFISWDDSVYLLDNPQINRRDGLKSIWRDVFRHEESEFQVPGRGERVARQYYPLVFSSYWLEFRLQEAVRGADSSLSVRENVQNKTLVPGLFHLVSVALHALNAFLVFQCLRMLGTSKFVTWVATLLFALHPMQVASVAWVAERKNTLSLAFYLVALLLYVKVRRDGGWWRYGLSILAFEAALLSKTAVATLPLVLFTVDRLLDRSWDRKGIQRSIARVLPFVVLSLIASFIAGVAESRDRAIDLNLSERPLVAARALLFYPIKMLMPVSQSPVYPLWQPDTGQLLWYVPPFVLALACYLVIRHRRRLDPRFIWALSFYAVTQLPMVGFIDINYFQFSFVADHYFYHGAIGLCLAAALVLQGCLQTMANPRWTPQNRPLIDTSKPAIRPAAESG